MELTIQHRTAPGFQGAMIERAAIGVTGNAEPLVGCRFTRVQAADPS
jgi:hypothetical protein